MSPDRSRLRAAVLALSSVLASCAAPRPSTQPLGFGPIAPGMRNDPVALRRPAEAKPKSTQREAASTEESDQGGAAAPATKETPSPEAKPAESTAASAAAPGTAKVTAAAFVGDYSGDDVSTYRMEGLPEREERDPNAKVSAKSDGEKSVSFVLVDSSNGKEICTLGGATDGAVATIAPGQTCFEQSGEDASATATIRRGTATLDKSKLTLDLELSFEMSVEGKDLAGTLVYHFEGTRK